jgi:large subunit ribosomal protein L13
MQRQQPNWHIIDAEDKVLGRISTEIATLLRGKHKPSFVPYLNGGDHVVVINASKVVLTGSKWDQKVYYRHSWYMGGLKSVLARTLLTTNPERIIEYAVRGMLPKNKLQKEWMTQLHVYAGTEHPHQANVAAK